jgi:hypothetical protein
VNRPTEFPLARRGEREQLRQAKAGLVPAEALPTHLRWRLVADLVRDGWTDVAIAEHTAMTTYTTCRIREGMQLPPNRPRAEELSA